MTKKYPKYFTCVICDITFNDIRILEDHEKFTHFVHILHGMKYRKLGRGSNFKSCIGKKHGN